MILSGGEPFFFPGGPYGCLLIHGFMSTPQEMRWLGSHLYQDGFTVLAIRLFGHATMLKDLRRARYSDWIASMEDGYCLLQKQCDKLIVVGASLGATLALIAGAKLSVDAIIAISPPYNLHSLSQTEQFILPSPILRNLGLGKRSFRKWFTFPIHHPQVKIDQLLYTSIPTRTLSEIDKLLTEMRRILPNITVPILLIHSDVETNLHLQNSEQFLDRLKTKRVKILRIKSSGSSETLQLEQERVATAITTFIANLSGSRL